MWLKCVLLLAYLVMLFVLARMLELVSWYQTGLTLSPQLIDPFSLSVTQLKRLLDLRGVNYATIVERQELRELVVVSGNVSREEVSGQEVGLAAPSTTQFSCGLHFYEEVEDTKDSAWLVQVASSDQMPLSDNTWRELASKMAQFGVRTGVFKCSLDRSLCLKKGWTSGRLILALPRGRKPKEDVVYYSYFLGPQQPKTSLIHQWVHDRMSSRMSAISSEKELQGWLSPSSWKSEIRVILFTTLIESPLFLSALAIRFTGRVKFGIVHLNKLNPKQRNFFGKGKKFPTYLVVTPEQKHEYGTRRGECFTFGSMERYLKSLSPEMNDVLLFSIFLSNICVSLNMFLKAGKLWKHLVRTLLMLVKYNCALFLTWLLILTLTKFTVIETATLALSKLVRLFAHTELASLLRYDWTYRCTTLFISISFLCYGLVIGYIWRRWWGRNAVDQDLSLFGNWSAILPWESYIMNYFFRPMATLTRPMAPHDLDLEEGMELLIERLAVPNLWLQPVFNTDYIKELPVWKWITESLFTSSSEDEASSNKNNVFCGEGSDSHLTETKSSLSSFPVQMPPNSDSSRPSCSKCLVPTEVSQMLSHHKRHKDRSSKHSTVHRPDESKISCQRPQGMLDSQECSICLENYIHGDVLCGLPCSHNFHCNCIMLWLIRDNHCCPVCRWPTYKQKHV